jgi:ubiquinone/menaquinone biosynthesis C-methylase UbiE
MRPDGAMTVASERGVRGVVIEVRDPAGSTRRHALQLDPGSSVVIGGPAGNSADPMRLRDLVWRRQASPISAETVAAYYAEHGTDPGSEEVKRTLATNTELVPARVETIVRYLSELQGVASLRGQRILDIGGGFGAFAVYLALHPDGPRVTSVDIRPEFVAGGQSVAARLGLANLEFAEADARALEGLADDTFTVVVLNNSFIYLPTKEDMRAALHQIARVTQPGGVVVMFHANRWRLREPFTGAPIVHLLPAGLADRVQRVTGWKHNHGRVRLVSTIWLARALRQAGLADVRSAGRFKRFYAVSARKPPTPPGSPRAGPAAR